MHLGFWMEEYQSKLEKRHPWRMALPGSHNSGVCFAGSAYRCQDLSVREQLEHGIRYLDLRVTKKLNGVLAVHHNNAVDPGGGHTIEDALIQVREFVDVHFMEIVVVRLCRGDGSTIKDNDAATYKKLADMAERIFEPKLIYPALYHAKADLRTLWNKKQNIILASEFPIAAKTWSIHDIASTWTGAQEGCESMSKKVGKLIPHLEACLRNRAAQPAFTAFDCSVWDMEIMESAKKYVNFPVFSALAEWGANPALRRNMGIFHMDCPDAYDARIPRRLVEFNLLDPVVEEPDRAAGSDPDAGGEVFSRESARALFARHNLDFDACMARPGSGNDAAVFAELVANGISEERARAFLLWHAVHGEHTLRNDHSLDHLAPIVDREMFDEKCAREECEALGLDYDRSMRLFREKGADRAVLAELAEKGMPIKRARAYLAWYQIYGQNKENAPS